NCAGSAVSNLLPFGGAAGVAVTFTMAGSWGHRKQAIAASTLVSGAWNVLSRLALPAAGLIVSIAAGNLPGRRFTVAAGLTAGLPDGGRSTPGRRRRHPRVRAEPAAGHRADRAGWRRGQRKRYRRPADRPRRAAGGHRGSAAAVRVLQLRDGDSGRRTGLAHLDGGEAVAHPAGHGVADAEADYQLVKDLRTKADLIDAYDAAVIERRADGKTRIV